MAPANHQLDFLPRRRRHSHRSEERPAKRTEPEGPSHSLLEAAAWPIALLATGGLLVGQSFDGRVGTEAHFSVLFMILGIVLGCFAAYQRLRSD